MPTVELGLERWEEAAWTLLCFRLPCASLACHLSLCDSNLGGPALVYTDVCTHMANTERNPGCMPGRDQLCWVCVSLFSLAPRQPRKVGVGLTSPFYR